MLAFVAVLVVHGILGKEIAGGRERERARCDGRVGGRRIGVGDEVPGGTEAVNPATVVCMSSVARPSRPPPPAAEDRFGHEDRADSHEHDAADVAASSAAALCAASVSSARSMTVRNSFLGRTDAERCAARAVPSGPVKALLYGVAPDPSAAAAAPATAENPLLENLAPTPMRLVDLDDPGFLRPDWVVTRPRLTGICGSDSKQVFMDWGDVRVARQPDEGVLLAAAGARATRSSPTSSRSARRREGLEVGDRVVLNPWLSCAPRGVDRCARRASAATSASASRSASGRSRRASTPVRRRTRAAATPS